MAGDDEIPIKPRDFLRRHPDKTEGYSVAQPNLGKQAAPASAAAPRPFPEQQIADLAGYLENPAGIDPGKAIQDVSDVLGWAGSLWAVVGGGGQQVTASAEQAGQSPADHAKALRDLAASHGPVKMGAATKAAPVKALPPWLLPLLLKVLQDVIGQLAGGGASAQAEQPGESAAPEGV